MNWYLETGKESDVVKSTRIRFLRNIKGFKFKLNKEEQEELENKIKENLYAIGYGLKFLKLKDMDNITKTSLVEKNLISSNFLVKKGNSGSILINDEENICIMIGGEDNLSIQVFSSGLELENTLNLAIEIEEKIGNILGYSINKKYGYLTSNLSDLGTALKVSVMVNLPALSKTGNLRALINTIRDFNVEICGEYGKVTKNNINNEETIFQISNKQTLGITEKEIIQNIKVITEKIIEQERKARKMLTKESLELEDLIWRSYGILTNCKKISYEEAKELITNIKIGTDLGLIDNLTDLKIQKLYLYTKPANLQKYLGEKYDKVDQEIKRAEIIKQIIK